MGNTPAASRLLRQLREQRGESLRRTAAELGVTPSHLSRLERGEKAPSDSLSRRAAEYYGVNEDLVYLEEGRVPADVLAILQGNPEILEELRQRFRAESAESV